MPASHRVDVSLEEVRSFWDRRPCNIRHSKRDVGTREYFDEVDRRRFLSNRTSLNLLSLKDGAIGRFSRSVAELEQT